MTLKAEGISKRYFRLSKSANYFTAVKPTDLTLAGGTVTVLMGRSGSGKTTLLNMLSGLLTPSQGKVWLDGADLYRMDDEALSRLRSRSLAIVPQGRSALDALTVMENMLLPRALYGKTGEKEQAEAEAWLERLGIASLRDARPAELSGGELRRMAVARALAGGPGVILADEPTGDLDNENTALVLQALRQAADGGAAVFLVTHEMDARAFADRVFQMEDGTLREGTD